MVNFSIQQKLTKTLKILNLRFLICHLFSDLSILLPFMRPIQEKLREEFRKKTITETSLADLQVIA